MLEAIEKLLILQERDRKLLHLQTELNVIPPQRQAIESGVQATHAAAEAAKLRAKQFESDRKKLELEVEGKQELITKYSLQQFQTKKNDEYRALAREIDHCKADIVKLEDQQLELMEQTEMAQHETIAAGQQAAARQEEANRQLAVLQEREGNLSAQLADLDTGRQALTQGIPSDLLGRYERLRQSKGERAIVGVEHGACGGCHMKLPAQIVVMCRGEQEIVQCPNCGRILYYTPDMDLEVAE